MASFDDEERDVLSDLYESISDAGDTPGTSEGRSLTSEERSVTPEMAETNSEGDSVDEIKEEPRPKLIVFDLDYTLWPFWVDRKINIEPPFKLVPHDKVHDASGREVRTFPGVTSLIQRLYGEGYKLAIASEAMMKDDVSHLVELFGWEEYIDYIEIYPGSKIFHFVNLKRQSGIDFPDMLYFDDEKEHLDEVASTCTGMTTIWADRGVSEELLEEALQTFAENRQSNTYFRSKPVGISRRNSQEPFVSLRAQINLKRRNSIEAQNDGLPLPYKPLQMNLKGFGLPNLATVTGKGPGLGGGAMPNKNRRRFSCIM